MIRRPPRSTRVRSSAASDVYKRQEADRKSETARGVEGRVFADAPLPDLSPDAWRDMWEAAERYITSGPSRYEFPPGNPEDKCPLCYQDLDCLLYTSPSPRDRTRSRMPSSA